MRGIVFLAVIGFFLTASGLRGVRQAALYSHPETTSYADFVKRRPSDGWYRITGCRIDVPEAVIKSNTYHQAVEISGALQDSGDMTAFFPVHSSSDTAQDTVSLAIDLSKDDLNAISALTDFCQQISQIKPGEEAKVKPWIAANRDRLILKHDLVGLVEGSIDVTSSEQKAIADASGMLQPDYVLLDYRQTPPPATKAIGMLVGGLAIDTLVALWVLQRVPALQRIRFRKGAQEPLS